MARRNLSDDIFEDLEHKILTGVYRINSRLPSERDLAKHYATSRIPVRTALSMLSERGYVRTQSGSGTVVISQGDSLFEREPVILSSAPDFNDMRFLLETLALRSRIEAESARLAAINRSEDDLRVIQDALFDSINEIRKLKLKEANRFFESDAAFHSAVVRASKSRFLQECYGTMPLIITSHQFWSLKFTQSRDEVVSYHTHIFESILDGDPESARQSMLDHLSRVEALIRQNPTMIEIH